MLLENLNYISSTFLLLLLLFTTSSGQEFRNKLLPDFDNFLHSDNTLNPYDFAGNYAWLAEDEKFDWLKISSGYTNIQGDYKRKYDYSESNNYSMNFTGVKHLPEGTFLGFASYKVEQRKNVYRSLKYDPYAGEAFFSIDTTAGDFTYKGPVVGFAFSFEILPHLFIGPKINYGILAGLKNKYSRAKILYREAEAGLGIAYKFNDNFVLGITTAYEDVQEEIESKSDGFSSVEIFNFRGETYSINDVGEIVTQNVIKKRYSLGSHLLFSPMKHIQFAAKSEFIQDKTSILIPRANVLIDEDGYADGNLINFSFQCRYHFLDNVKYGAFVEYNSRESSSKISQYNLVIWNWNVKELKLGNGLTYHFKEIPLIVAAEIEYISSKADSAKYIDHRAADLNSNDYFFKIVVEYKISDRLYLSSGFQSGYKKLDLISAGKNVSCTILGISICRQWQEFQADLTINYLSEKPRAGSNRQKFIADIEFKYFTF